jgi:hypothetical protein
MSSREEQPMDFFARRSAPRGFKDPVEGSLHVVGATQLDPGRLRAPCHITYVIQAEGVETFSGETEVFAWTRQWPTPGQDLPVVFDRANPTKVQIEWDQVTTHQPTHKE